MKMIYGIFVLFTLYSSLTVAKNIEIDIQGALACDDPVFNPDGNCNQQVEKVVLESALGTEIPQDQIRSDQVSIRRSFIFSTEPLPQRTRRARPRPEDRDKDDIIEQSDKGDDEDSQVTKNDEDEAGNFKAVPTIASQNELNSNGYKAPQGRSIGSGNVEVRNGFVYKRPTVKNNQIAQNQRNNRFKNQDFQSRNTGLQALKANRNNFGGNTIDEESQSSGQGVSGFGSFDSNSPNGPNGNSTPSKVAKNTKKKRAPKSALDKIANALGLNRFFGANGSSIAKGMRGLFGIKNTKNRSRRSPASIGGVSPPDLNRIYGKQRANKSPLIFDDEHSILFHVCENHKSYGKANNLVYHTNPCSED